MTRARTLHSWIACASCFTACADQGSSADAESATESAGSGESENGDTSDSSETTGGGPDLPTPLICDPDGGGPYWLLELEMVAVPITCLTGYDLPGSAFEIDPMPPGAIWNADSATLEWTPGLDQGAVYELNVTATDLGESAAFKIGVADRWDHPDNVPVLDPTLYTEEYGLPVLHLVPGPGLNAATYSPASITYRGHEYMTPEAKLRGAASLAYPKNNYTLKFTKDDKFSEPNFAGGFFEKRKVTLITTFDDNAYVRQRMAYELWNRLDPDHIQVQVYSGVLFLNNQYWGLYTIADHVDGYLMEDHGMDQNGNLYKARTHDANFRLTNAENLPKQTMHDGLTKSEGIPIEGLPGAFDDLDAFVTFVATSSSPEFLDQMPAMIRQRDYENWWIFVTLIEGDDSAGKNSYHYHDPLLDTPWRYVPWDFNHSFGQTWQTARQGFDAHPEGYAWANELFTRFLAEPSIGNPLRARYGDELSDVYRIDDVLAVYDAMIEEIDPSARRDEGRWGVEYQNYWGWNWRNDFLSYEDEVDYTREWMIDRWNFVDAIY